MFVVAGMLGSLPKMRNRPAQTLIVVLLVMIVSLTIGLAVASRSVSGLREATTTAQSTTAYHAAEAGVEECLKKLSEDSGYRRATNWGNCAADTDGATTLSGSGASYRCLVAGVSGDFTAEVEQDAVAEVNLDGLALANRTVTVSWHNTALGDSDSAALTFWLAEERGDGTYYTVKSAFDGNASRRSAENHFDLPSPGASGYALSATVNTENVPANRRRLLRIRPLYAGTNLKVSVQGATLPPQQVEVRCEGELGEVKRTVQVLRGNPALPALFDYAIFSGSATVPLSK